MTMYLPSFLSIYTSFIVHMGWTAHVPPMSTLTKSYRSRWRLVIKKIHGWMYSWMNPNMVENEMEYKISKFILMQFICSGPVLAAAEGHTFIILRILRFVRHYVWIYEGQYVWYLRKDIRSMFTAHSSAHKVSLVCITY